METNFFERIGRSDSPWFVHPASGSFATEEPPEDCPTYSLDVVSTA